MSRIISDALDNGQTALSEFQSKQLLQAAGIRITRESEAATREQARDLARSIGFPVALKASSPDILHKTEQGLVKLNLQTDADVCSAWDAIALRSSCPPRVLVQEMLKPEREFMAGIIRDRQFGPCVMFGLGGIFAEVLDDVAFRVAPFPVEEALEMIGEISSQRMLGPLRGFPPVDVTDLARMLTCLGDLAWKESSIREMDINPVMIANGRPVAADALVILTNGNLQDT